MDYTVAKKFKGTLEDGLLNLIEANGQDGFGYVNVTTKDKKNGHIYVRYGTIVAILNNNYKTNILVRVTSLEDMNDRSREMLRQRFVNDEGNINMVEAALDQQMASSNELSKIMKENFIDSFYDMWKWGPAVLEWVQNKEPNVPTVPAIQPTDLIQKAELIDSKISNEIAPMFGVPEEEILSLTPQIGDNQDYSNLRPNEITILQYSNGEHTLEDIIYGTGISLSGSQFAIARLWLNRHLFLRRESGEVIFFETDEPEQPEEEIQETYVASQEQVSDVLHEPEPEEEYTRDAVDTELVIEDTTDDAHAEEEEEDSEEPDFDSFFEEEKPQKPAEIEYPTELERRPRKLTFQEALAMTEEPEMFNKDDALELKPHVSTSSLLEEIEADSRSTPPAGVNNRFAAIMEQVKELMMQSKANLAESEQALRAKKEEIESLHAQRTELNLRIQQSEAEYGSLLSKDEALTNEYREIVEQIKGMEGTL